MRVLQVITDTDRRGAQVFARDLHDELEHLGHEVVTVALAPGPNRDGAVLSVDTLGRTGRSPFTLWRLRRRMGAADVTIAHGSSTLLACAVASIGMRRPWIYRQVSDPLFWAGTSSRAFRVRRYLRRADAVTALTPTTSEVLKQFFGVPQANLTVIPNGVSAARFHPPNNDERRSARQRFGLDERTFVVLCVGALVPEKGVALAIAAVASNPSAQLFVAGEGPQRDALESLAESNAPGRVRFFGAVANIVPMYHAADVVVFPSLTDAMPAALIEAGLCGLAAVSTAVGAAPEVVIDGETGVLVGVNDVVALREALAALGDEPTRRQAMGAAATAHCTANYEIRVVAEAWSALLQRVAVTKIPA